MWPIGLNSKRDVSAVVTPIITSETDSDGKELSRIIGQTNGETLLLGSFQIHRGAFAVDLEYLRTVWTSNFTMKFTRCNLLTAKK